MRLLLLCSCWFGSVQALWANGESKARGTLFLQFKTDNSDDQWKAAAVEDAVRSYLDAFANLTVVSSPEQADYLMDGQYEEGSLRYEIRDRRTTSRLDSGVMDVHGTGSSSVQIQTLRAFRPLVRAGGLIDMRAHVTLSQRSPLSWLLSILGGCLWAVLLLRVGRFAGGSMAGVQRIDHLNLRRFLQAWLEVTSAKLLIALFYVGVWIFIAYKVRPVQLLSHDDFWIWGAPAAGVLSLVTLYLSNLLLSRYLSFRILRHENRKYWEDRLKRYFHGYRRRLGVHIPEGILDSLQFHVGRVDQVVVFGGMGSKVKIVLPQWLAEAAIGAAPFYQPIDKNRELAVTNEAPEPHSRWEAKSIIFPKSLLASAKIKSRTESIEVPVELEPAEIPQESQVRTWGSILPTPKGESIPLISNHQEDLDVVEELVLEHHIHFAKGQLEEEYDDTNPRHKDFLFGLMLRAVGHAQRRETLLTGFGYAAHGLIQGLPRFLAFFPDLLIVLYERNFSRFPAVLADAYVALHQAGHHLVQAIYFQAMRRESILTSRTSRKTMAMRTHEVYADIERQISATPVQFRYQADYRNRLMWLANHFEFGQARRTDSQALGWPWKRALIGIAVLVVVGLESYAAWTYHPEYLARIEQTKKKIEDFEKQKGQENGKG